MKRSLACIGTSILLGLSGTLYAQHSLPSSSIRYIQRHSLQAVAESSLGIKHIYPRPRLALSEEQLSYNRQLSSYLEGKLGAEPEGLNLERIKLLRALLQFEQGPEVKPLLQSINRSGLYLYECDQLDLLEGYLLLQGTKQEQGLAEQILRKLSSKDSPLAEQARLYLASLTWSQGKPQEAQRQLEQGQWSEENMPEVEYLGSLLSYSLDKPEVAIANSHRLIERYPEMSSRPRLWGMMGQSYYSQKEYSKAIEALRHISEESPRLSEESFALGASLYALGKDAEAISPLQEASASDTSISPYALLALGNIAEKRQNASEAQLAYERGYRSLQADKGVKEELLYRLIELGNKGGHNAFGSQIKNAQTFLRDYPSSQYRARILELVRGYISSSSNYGAGLDLINSLEKQGLKLADLRQELYLKQAISYQQEGMSFQAPLSQAIQLGSVNPEAYQLALLMRSEASLRSKAYPAAERDANLAISSSPAQRARAYYLLGYSLYNQKRYPESITAFERFLTEEKDGEQRGDAYLRQGDSYLSQDQYTQALASYQKAEQALTNGGADEALYRISSIYQKQGKYAQQIEQINRALNQHPHTYYAPEMLYQRGRAERMTKQTTEALSSFASVVSDYPNSALAPTAQLEIALIHSNLEQDASAIKAYKSLISNYPNSNEAEIALADLRSLYTEQGQLDEYLSYARSLEGKLKPSAKDEAHLRFASIEDKIRRQTGGDTTALLEAYLRDYPNSADSPKAHRLLADTYYQQGRGNEAFTHLHRAIELSPNGEEKLGHQLRLAELLKEGGNEAEAYKAYHACYQLAQGTKLYSQQAAKGLLQTAAKAKKHSEAIAIANALLKQGDLSPRQKEEFTLLRGKLEEDQKSLNVALTTYLSLEKSVQSPYGAEAIVRYADLQIRLKKYADAQAKLEAFIGSGTEQSYWLARAFVLLSDLHDKQGDQYTAKQYLQSLKENYSGTEADILEMIDQRLSKYQD